MCDNNPAETVPKEEYDRLKLLYSQLINNDLPSLRKENLELKRRLLQQSGTNISTMTCSDTEKGYVESPCRRVRICKDNTIEIGTWDVNTGDLIKGTCIQADGHVESGDWDLTTGYLKEGYIQSTTGEVQYGVRNSVTNTLIKGVSKGSGGEIMVSESTNDNKFTNIVKVNLNLSSCFISATNPDYVFVNPRSIR